MDSADCKTREVFEDLTYSMSDAERVKERQGLCLRTILTMLES